MKFTRRTATIFVATILSVASLASCGSDYETNTEPDTVNLTSTCIRTDYRAFYQGSTLSAVVLDTENC